jgi:hypothetical protein
MAKMAWYDTAQLAVLEKAKDDLDWFTAVVLSSIQLERHGYLMIKEHLESLEVDFRKDILEKLSLSQIALFLLAIRKIDSNEYGTIMEINSERNKFMHRREAKRYARGAEARKKYDPLIEEAIRILKEKFNVMRLYVSKS